MTEEKILEVVARYRHRFTLENIPKRRMNPHCFFSPHRNASTRQMLMHAHYLLDGIEAYAKDPARTGKTGRHLGSCQTLLWAAGWYTLDELMQHNRSFTD